MNFSVITNRKGKVVFSASAIPSGANQVIRFFHDQNGYLESEGDLLETIDAAKNTFDCPNIEFNIAAAILLNAKNYLLGEDSQDLLLELGSMDVDIFLDVTKTFMPKGAPEGFILSFVPS